MTAAGVFTLFLNVFVGDESDLRRFEALCGDGVVFFGGVGIQPSEHLVFFDDFQDTFSPVKINPRDFHGSAEYNADILLIIFSDIQFLLAVQRYVSGLKAAHHAQTVLIGDVVKKWDFGKIHKKTSCTVAFATAYFRYYGIIKTDKRKQAFENFTPAA